MSEVVARFSLENNPLNVRYSLSDGSEVDAIFKINAAGTTWGSIDGTLSNQTDLQNALNLKADKTELDADIQEVNTSINTLSQTVTANYNALDGKIDTEIASRTLADTTLQNNIDAEALARQNADTTLQGNIDTLSQTVTDNNTAINNRVDGVVSAFDDEIEIINNNISDLSDTVSDNYTDLNDKISDNAGDITDINNTINTYGDIVTYNAADFATSTQGALADSALQSGDNISELVNNVGYITSASLPTDYVPNTRTINGYALSSNITLNYSDVGALSSSTTINDLTTTAQQNALNSGATATNIGQITTNANDISDIQDLIPNQASSSNQLADKDFVNSSIATNTANFIGTFNSVAELEAYSGTLTNNDYAFVATTDSAGNTLYDRYKYNADTQEWLFEYELNNSSFTAQQWASINSGATTTNIGQIATNTSNISDLQTNKQDVLTAGANIQINNNVISATDTTYTAGTGISIVNGVISNTQTSAEWGNITGVLSSQTDLQDALDDKYDASNPSGFITGITSSDVTTALGYTPYNSTNPNGYITISALNGYATETWVTNQGYITGITSSDVTTALGYTPYNATNPNGYITGITSGDVTTALGYTPLSNTTKYGSSLSYSSNVLQLLDQDGNGLGSSVTIQSSPDIDNKSITTNSSDELQTVGVIDQNNTTNAIKTWTGTKAQYDAIVTKDSNTLYWLTDVKIIYLGDVAVGNFKGGRNVGEIISSTLPLTDAGLHLLDGSLIQGGGIYQGFVDYIAELYDNTSVSGYKLNVNVTGSVTNNNGVLSNFSTSNYANFPSNFQPGSNPWEMVFKITTGTISSSWQHILAFQKGLTNAERYATRLSITNNNKFGITLSYNGTAWDVPGETTGQGTYTVLSNTTYYLKVQYTGSAYILSYSLDGDNYIQDCYVTSSTPIYNANTASLIGIWNNGSYVEPFLGLIDLKESYININNSRWWTGAEAIKPCFCTESEWQTSVEEYGVCGKFVYDSVNNTVRLPKVTGKLDGTTDLTALGDLEPLMVKLPNITGRVAIYARPEKASGVFYLNGTGSNVTRIGDYGNYYINFDASRSSSVYSGNGTDTTIHEQAINVLYYIVIANSTKTEIQSDIDEITTDLNGKADTDLTNITNTALTKMANASMPSTTYINLTLGASSTTYTAPADGYMNVVKYSGGVNEFLYIAPLNEEFAYEWVANYAGEPIQVTVPWAKGMIYKIAYNLSGSTLHFRFVYAEGSKWEA